MRYWQYTYPTDGHYNYGVANYSDEDIIKEYWDYWCNRMIEVGKAHLITRENCIDDWIVTNWANEITEEEYNKKRI